MAISLEWHLEVNLENKSMANACDSGPLSSSHGCSLLSLSRRVVIIMGSLESGIALRTSHPSPRVVINPTHVGVLILFYS